MFVLIILLTIILIALGSIECSITQKRINKVKIRILVNGTRGKTTIVRLLTSSLQSAGIRTIGRTTGSEAQIINTDGSISAIKRNRSARIYELVRFWRLAEKEEAECAVVECMGLMKESQIAIRDKLVRPDIVVIANTFVDHVPEMGRTRESTSEVLALSIPEDAMLYVTDHYYDHFKNVNFIDIDDAASPREDIHPSAIAIVGAILKYLDIDEEYLERGINSFIPDKGLLKPFECGDRSLFIPSFSINDLSSMDSAVKRYSQNSKINLIYNNRKDREFRIELFDEVLKANKDKIDRVYVIGDYKKKVARHYSKLIQSEAIDIETLKGIMEKSHDNIYLALGNIKGEGEELIALFI